MNHLSDKQCGDVMVIFTTSWRYFCCASLLAFICQFILFIYSLIDNLTFFISTLLFIVSHYFIFRLWFDSHLFKILYQRQEPYHFDLALHYLFPKKQPVATMEQRWAGTKRLFNYTLLLTILLWLWVLISLLTGN
ncbi:hypothetical protein ACRU1U_09560 [Providencia stuartii]|uniref:Uncharacterized protein n=5 Tax=Providencia stuartii TaxID=588 RepID=A0AA86YLH2_PROST|nr:MULTISPECIES: hypothetical protein [Providencia]AFH95806.1 hypothetical protein S70_20105 [Providencia stuartii MRSN 2154]EDU59225.1 hypothetical protein PROSTU_02413 [Providencia stuartii ATCC 25827]QPN38865.1 hypothetical protein I3B46_11830 [Providencia sp. 2.29]SST01433.1 Uncharacterised protein [Acinetobacter baumannii]AIN62735.1 hypothetical protein DR96_2920 [Providencia stuartii]